MNEGKSIFSQLIGFLPDREFRRCVARYGGDRYTKKLSCWEQYLAMAFAQLTYRESLRDIEACLGAIGPKLYHLGIGAAVARSTLADANENRDWRIFADFAQVLIRTAIKLYANDSTGIKDVRDLYALDSTTIDLCLALSNVSIALPCHRPSLWCAPRLTCSSNGAIHARSIRRPAYAATIRSF